MSTKDIASDQLRGVEAIAAFRGEKPRRTRYLIAKGEVPVAREGNTIVASKRRLLNEWDALTGIAEPARHDARGTPSLTT
jgi:hypothetical protein